MTDLNALYPEDAPAGPTSARPAGPMARQTTEAEDILYPNDRPRIDGEPAQRSMPTTAGSEEGEPPALSYSDQAAFDATDTNSFFNQAALAALQDGDRARAAELGQASKTLVQDFSAAGTPSEIVNDALRAFNDAAYNGVTEAPDAIIAQLSQEFGPTLERDLAAARSLIIELDRKTPGLIDSLNATGAGNDPRVIRAAIREARRRGGRR